MVGGCPKCKLDMTEFSVEDFEEHALFHFLLETAPKSIPSQSTKIPDRPDDSRRSSSGWPLYWSAK